MTINLEDFVDKEVIITLNNGQVIETTVHKESDWYVGSYPYYYQYKDKERNVVRISRKNGINDNYLYNIKSIQLKNQYKPMTKLSDKAFRNLVNALTSEVISYIEKDERYVNFMQEVIPDALSDLMGQLDEDLRCELSMSIMDNIMFRSVK